MSCSERAKATGPVRHLRFAIYAIMAAVIFLYIYLLPTMAAFEDTIPHLIRNAMYFIAKKPLRFVVIAFFDIFPLVLTYTDLKMMPLYAFIWAMCGFGLLAMLGATLLLPVFKPFLPVVDSDGDFVADPNEDEYSSVDDLRELDGF